MNHELLHCELPNPTGEVGGGIRFYCRCGWVCPPNVKHPPVAFIDHLNVLNEPQVVIKYRGDAYRHWWKP